MANNGPTRDQILGKLASREATSAADPDIAEHHGVDKRKARLRIMKKIADNWAYYKSYPLFQKPGMATASGLTDEGGRKVREMVVKHLREAPHTHGFPANLMFATTWDIGDTLKNCWHLNRGSGQRERTEDRLYDYAGANATPQMKAYSAGGEKNNANFQPNTRPFYASLNYSRARFGGSSRWGKTHFILKSHMRFNATYLHADSFIVETDHGDRAAEHLANYHNMYPILLDVRAGGVDRQGAAVFDILRSIIDHALGLKVPPREEFDGSAYIEAQIPGDIVISRDIEKVVVEAAQFSPSSKIGKNLVKFADKKSLQIEFV